MKKLSLLSAGCILALFLASCGGSSSVGGSVDTDGDGISDSQDLICPNSPKIFISDKSTDHDGDGCRDIDEDEDDDNDGIPDFEKDGATQKDQCPKGSVFNSNISTDYDGDGCKDDDPDGEDDDDDNDNVNDFEIDGITQKDLCPRGNSFTSNSSTDHDGDGCKDDDPDGEDKDDDNDGVTDFEIDGITKKDLCRTSRNPDFVSVSTGNDITDYDGDGCEDAGEDIDDDNDTVPDAQDAECPKTPFGSADYDSDGCEDSKDTDDDDDGVTDFVSGASRKTNASKAVYLPA